MWPTLYWFCYPSKEFFTLLFIYSRPRASITSFTFTSSQRNKDDKTKQKFEYSKALPKLKYRNDYGDILDDCDDATIKNWCDNALNIKQREHSSRREISCFFWETPEKSAQCFNFKKIYMKCCHDSESQKIEIKRTSLLGLPNWKKAQGIFWFNKNNTGNGAGTDKHFALSFGNEKEEFFHFF